MPNLLTREPSVNDLISFKKEMVSHTYASYMRVIILSYVVKKNMKKKKKKELLTRKNDDEQKAGSVLSSVAILYHEVDNLDAAVQMSLAHLRILVDEFDRTADALLSSGSSGSESTPLLDAGEVDAVFRVVDALRMVNTGNLEWRFVFFFAPAPLPPSYS